MSSIISSHLSKFIDDLFVKMDNHKMLTFGIALLIVVVARLLYDRKQLMDPLGHKHFEFYVRSGRNTHEYTRHILHVGGLNSAARRCKFCREERRKELVSLPNKPYEDFVQEASVIETKQSNENYLLYNRKQLMDPLGHKHIEIIQNVNDCERIVNVLKCHCQTIKVLGFDCEWVTFGSRTWPVALLQLSSSKGLCALFRLCSMKQIPKSLRDLLEDDEVVKVGVDPSGDAKKLWYDYGVGVASTYDLRFLAATTGTKPEGLARMSQSVLNVVLDKNWRLACSNWEAKELTDEQLDYAANDALVAVEIFKKLSSHLDPKNLLSKLDFESIRLRIEPFLEVSYQEGYLTNVKKSKKNKNSAGLGALEDRYLSYNLETWVEPAGVCDHNQCVVCGYNEAYIRKHVVPREYRKHFPVVMKTHSSHNGFLLCQPCHKISKMSDLHIRHKLAKLCNAPFTHEDRSGKFKEISEHVYTAAQTFVKHSDGISEERRKQLVSFLNKHYEDLLQEASVIETKQSNENYFNHGEQVVCSFQYGPGLVELEKIWRQHFLRTMQPFLTFHWHINQYTYQPICSRY